MVPPAPNPVEDQVANEDCGNPTHEAQHRERTVKAEGDEVNRIHLSRLKLCRARVNASLHSMALLADGWHLSTHVAAFLITCVTATAWAQGTVIFNNNTAFATIAERRMRCADGPLVGTHFVAQLYYGTQGTSANSLVPVASPPARFRIPTTTQPGTWSGGTRTLEGITFGQTATLQVRVWNYSLFPTYDASVSGGGVRGATASFDYTVPSPGSPPQAFFMENLRGFTILAPCIPEPSTIALAALGAAGLGFVARFRLSKARRLVQIPGVVGCARSSVG